MLVRAWSVNMLPFRGGRGQKSHWLAGTRQKKTAVWWSHPTQCPLGLFCNDQHVWTYLALHMSTVDLNCVLFTQTNMNGLYTIGDDCILFRYFWACFAVMHVYLNQQWTHFFFLSATICSPLGTLIMANECFQAQSLIYLYRPKT